MNALFVEQYQIKLGKDLVADGTSEVTSAVEDMAGYDEIVFLVGLGDIDAAAVLTFAVKQNTASHVSNPTPTGVTITSVSAGVITNGNLVLTESAGNLDDKIIVITARKQSMSARYVFLSITATVESFEIDKLITLKGKPRTMPVTQTTDVGAVANAIA